MGYQLNDILSDEEYMAEGFTKAECPLIRRHDMLYNQRVKYGELKPRKEAELFEIIRRLGL